MAHTSLKQLLRMYLYAFRRIRHPALPAFLSMAALFFALSLLTHAPGFEARLFSTSAQICMPLLGAWITVCMLHAVLFEREVLFTLPVSRCFLGIGRVMAGVTVFCLSMGACLYGAVSLGRLNCNTFTFWLLLSSQTYFYSALCFAVIVFTHSVGTGIGISFAYLLAAFLTKNLLPDFLMIYTNIFQWPSDDEILICILRGCVFGTVLTAMAQLRFSKS